MRLRWLPAGMIILAALSVTGDASAAQAKRAGSRRAVQEFQPFEMEATVVSFRRDESGIYVGALRDDGSYDLIRIDRDDEIEVNQGQRVAYTITSRPQQSSRAGEWYREGSYLRVVLPKTKVYQGTGSDGALIFTDNPTAIPTTGPAKGKTYR